MYHVRLLLVCGLRLPVLQALGGGGGYKHWGGGYKHWGVLKHWDVPQDMCYKHWDVLQEVCYKHWGGGGLQALGCVKALGCAPGYVLQALGCAPGGVLQALGCAPGGVLQALGCVTSTGVCPRRCGPIMKWDTSTKN